MNKSKFEPMPAYGYTKKLDIQRKSLSISAVQKDFYYVVDRFVGRHIHVAGVYEPLVTIMFLNDIIKFPENSITLDIGAHFGYYSVLFASMAPKSQIYAFEPMNINFEILTLNAEQYDNITPCNYAISDKTGTAKLYCDMSNTGHNALVPLEIDKNDFLAKEMIKECQTSTIDRFGINFNRVNFVKIDTEETALEVFAHIAPYLPINCLVLLEVMGGRHEEVADIMNSQGFASVHPRINGVSLEYIIDGDKFLVIKT